MPKYRKKPVVIDAVRWDGTEAAFDQLKRLGLKGAEYNLHPPGLLIPTIDGDMRANVGDWVIRGVKGEFYPCKPDIFEATYEEVTE